MSRKRRPSEEGRDYDEEDYSVFDIEPWMISWIDGTVRVTEDGHPFYWIETIEFNTPCWLDEPQYPRQIILFIDSRDTKYKKCPNCKALIAHPTIVIVLEDYHILPCILCEMMVWMNNNPHLRMESGACDEVRE